MSIKVKFIIALAVIFAISLASVVMTNITFHSLMQSEKELLTQENLSRRSVIREVQHLQWLNGLAVYLLHSEQKDPSVEIDHTRCAFGQWYYSPSRTQTVQQFPELAGVLNGLERPHADLHATAVTIAKLKSEGKQQEAVAIFEKETVRLLNDVQSRFLDLRNTLDQNIAQMNKRIEEQTSTGTTLILAFGVISCLSVLALGFFFFRSVLTPLKAINEYAVQCQTDPQSARVPAHGDDEMGTMVKSLTALVQNLGQQLAFSDGVFQGLTVPCSLFSADDKTLFTNRHMMDLIERDGKPEDYYGMTSGEYIWGDKNKKTLSTRALEEKKMLSVSMDFNTHKGNARHAKVTSAPFFDRDGKLLGSLSIWMDTTELVNQQKVLAENAQRIAEVAESSMNIADQVSRGSQELAAQVEQSSTDARRQYDRVSETATAMTEMNATVGEVARSAAEASSMADDAKARADEGGQAVTELLHSVDDVKRIAGELKISMGKLSEQAQDVGHIIEVINDIADQTNLLALNAAIEAARAGDAGRGFAVVADSVRQLAEKTMQATGKVGEVISGIQSGTQDNIKHVDQAVSAVDLSSELSLRAGEKLREIMEVVDGTAQRIQSIAAASEEQSASSEEINRALEEVRLISDETSMVMNEAQQAVTSMAEQASSLRVLIDRLRS